MCPTSISARLIKLRVQVGRCTRFFDVKRLICSKLLKGHFSKVGDQCHVIPSSLALELVQASAGSVKEEVRTIPIAFIGQNNAVFP